MSDNGDRDGEGGGAGSDGGTGNNGSASASAGHGRDLVFVPLPELTNEDIAELTLRIARRLTGVVERHCADACETEEILGRTAAALREALARAVGPPHGAQQLGFPHADLQPKAKPLCSTVAGCA